MEFIVRYLIIASVCIATSYIAFRLIFRKDSNFRVQRIFLLASVVLSLILPFNNLRIDLHLPLIEKISTENFTIGKNRTNVNTSNYANYKNNQKQESILSSWNNRISMLCLYIYCIVSLSLLIRLIIQTASVYLCYKRSEKVVHNGYRVVLNDHFKNAFTFLNKIFIHSSLAFEEDIEKIIAHEAVHARQLHFIDLLLIEAATIFLWFNPFLWMTKKSIQLNHEYLADRGVIDSGIDKVSYQALLINQIAEAKLINLTSGFNHSLIKQRILMMAQKHVNESNTRKFLLIVPVFGLLFFGVSCTNSEKQGHSIPAIEFPDMYPLFTGFDNPLHFSVSGYENVDLEVNINPGTLKCENGEYYARFDEPGSAILTISKDGDEVQKIKYKIKIPDKALLKSMLGQLDPNEITQEFWLDGLNIDENEYLKLVNWVEDSIAKAKKMEPEEKEIEAKLWY